ncbi:hypothetical protein PQX77_007191 [Marasmius sp. AFHP31]|nr:hypothetical protein PQX77_007191 [Marasmius sp. AFHP31]
MSSPPSERTATLPDNTSEVEKHESQDSEASNLNPPFVDGGVRGWSTVAGSWFLLFSTLGWMGSVQLALPFLIAVPAGRLFDAGYIHSVIATGSVIFSFSLFMLSLAQRDQYYQMFLSQGLGMGIGVGCVQLHSATIVSRHFVRRRALAYGVALTGASVGSVVFPILLNHLIYSIGFADAVRVSGYISLGGLVAGNLLVRTPTKKIAFREAPPTFLSFLKDPAFVFFVAGTVISFLGFYFPSKFTGDLHFPCYYEIWHANAAESLVIYLQLFAVEKSIDTKMAFYSIAILNGSGVVGRIVANHMADVFGLFNIQVPCTFITAALIWLVLAIKNVASLVTVSALYGLFSGAWLSLCMVATAVLSKSPSEVGARTGMTMGAVGVSVLFSAPIQGAVLGKDDMWIRSVAVSASFMLVGAVLTLVAGVLMHKGKRGP